MLAIRVSGGSATTGGCLAVGRSLVVRARSASRFAGVPTLPLVLGVPLGFMVRSDHRRGRPIPGGDQAVFLQDRVALILPSLAAALAAWSLWREFGRTT